MCARNGEGVRGYCTPKITMSIQAEIKRWTSTPYNISGCHLWKIVDEILSVKIYQIWTIHINSFETYFHKSKIKSVLPLWHKVPRPIKCHQFSVYWINIHGHYFTTYQSALWNISVERKRLHSWSKAEKLWKKSKYKQSSMCPCAHWNNDIHPLIH